MSLSQNLDLIAIPTVIEMWMKTLFEAPVSQQVLLLLPGRSKLRSFRVTNKTYSIFNLSRSLVVYPDGYRQVNLKEYEGWDGTAPRLNNVEFSVDDTANLLRTWRDHAPDSTVIMVDEGSPFWSKVGELADIPHTNEIPLNELSQHFVLETGEAEDSTVRWPRSLRRYLDGLSEEDSVRLTGYVLNG